MPNWCNNTICFYQEDDGTDMVEAFYADVEKYQNYQDDENGGSSNWIGHWLKSSKHDTEQLYTRGFFVCCELNSDHVRIDMETAWAPLPEVYDLMAEKYGLSYVYIAEEPGCAIYINTDTTGRFFTDRYILDYFDVDDLGLDDETIVEYGERLKELGGDAMYFASFDEVMDKFVDFGFVADDVESLNMLLEQFNIEVHEYSSE